MKTRNTVFFALTAAAVAFSFAAWACNVPVFRYALERWPADPYEIMVFRDAPLTADERAAVELAERASSGTSPANCTVINVDLSGDVPPAMREVWERLERPALPCAAVRFPGETAFRLAFHPVALTEETMRGILDSPARSELSRRIGSGESAVWLFIESGDVGADDEAAALLGKHLEELESTLSLPGAVDGTYGAQAVDTSAGPDVRISFSVLRVSRNDPGEAALVDMLMHSEPGLDGYSGSPMVFPVYGRGRALYALVGKGINERNIRAAGEFLTGACSCEVKALNPGVDLLVSADWDSFVTESWIDDEEPPPLVSVAELAVQARAAKETADPPAPGANTGPEEDAVSLNRDTVAAKAPAGAMNRNVLVAVGAFVLVIAAGTVSISLKKRG